MAKEFFFNGEKIVRPGIYAAIESGIKNPPIELAFGAILVIDTDSGATYGGGPGINGTLKTGKDTINTFDNIDDFRKHVRGGLWYALAEPLFRPASGVNGISSITFIKAATTVPAELTFSPIGGGANGGSLVLQVRDEGLVGNGSEDSGSMLRKGNAFTMTIGEVDPAKFILKFWQGTYTGLADDGIPYGETAEADSKPKLLLQSIEFDDMTDLTAWANADSTLNSFFSVKTATVAGDGSVDSADLATFAGNTLAISGTETYGTTDLDDVLTNITDQRYSAVLCDKWGDDAQGSENGKILIHLEEEAKHGFNMYVGGGKDSTKFTQTNGSIPIAQFYDTEQAIIVHSGSKRASNLSSSGFREWDSIYTAALVIGRIGGLEPQTPGSWKIVNIDGLLHNLTDREKDIALQAGVLMVHFDTQLPIPDFTILQSVNSLQNNTELINPDGQSHAIEIGRIKSQLNSEFIINARRDLFGGEDGPNQNTLSDRYVLDWTAGQLENNTVTATEDNMIIEYRNITVQTIGDAKQVTYEFKPNGPINKFFITGFMVN